MTQGIAGPNYGRNESKRRRKEIVDRVREEGAKAFRDGKHEQSCPYPKTSMNRFQWLQGYDMADYESEDKEGA